MEAMSFGVPVIATNGGGNTEIVNELNGHILSADPTAKEITNALETYFNLPIQARYSKKQEALNTWKKLYDSNANYTAFCHEILEL